jgi:outer membrane protein assembly factor BamB
MTARLLLCPTALSFALFFAGVSPASAAEWPQWGGSSLRNNVAETSSLPVEWEAGDFDRKTGAWDKDSAKNIRWVARLGSESYGSPVIGQGKVFAATNNEAGYLERFPASVDLGCLLAFSQADGRFLWQYSSPKHEAGSDVDWAKVGICANPLVEGQRMWLVDNRGVVVCLDTEGFADGQNDGPFTAEESAARNEADVLWSFDMPRKLGTVQHNMASCSVTAAGDLLMVLTANGIDGEHETIPAPQAPSFIALDKNTGALVWADNSPGENILHGQWGSPAVGELGGVRQAIFPGGDGWLYSFLAAPGTGGKPKLLWKFDCNPKASVWEDGGSGDRNSLIATPVIHQGRVYIATGEDPESGEGQGDLWCIDPAKRLDGSDVSAERVVDRAGKPVAPRRVAALDAAADEKTIPNPASAAVWHYRGNDPNGDGKMDFEETMHRTLGMVAIRDGLLVVADFAGVVHCLDVQTGQPLWTHDMLATMWGSPLVADNKIFIGDEDGDVAVFELAREKNLLAENSMDDSVYSTPAAIGDTLYISTRSHVFAIGGGAGKKE